MPPKPSHGCGQVLVGVIRSDDLAAPKTPRRKDSAGTSGFLGWTGSPESPGGCMIEAKALTKRYGNKLAVDGLTFTVKPGVITGFLGPNGAGKSTTMRMIMGLDY